MSSSSFSRGISTDDGLVLVRVDIVGSGCHIGLAKVSVS